LTLRVSVVTGIRSFLAAAERLPSSTEATSIAIASSLSTWHTSNGRGVGIHEVFPTAVRDSTRVTKTQEPLLASLGVNPQVSIHSDARY